MRATDVSNLMFLYQFQRSCEIKDVGEYESRREKNGTEFIFKFSLGLFIYSYVINYSHLLTMFQPQELCNVQKDGAAIMNGEVQVMLPPVHVMKTEWRYSPTHS